VCCDRGVSWAASTGLCAFLSAGSQDQAVHLWSVRMTARNFRTFCGALSPDPSVLEQCKQATKIKINFASWNLL
jgi:hypothetical protein